MDLSEFNQTRRRLNDRLAESASFFSEFETLTETVFSEGAIPKKYKELTGLTISVFSKCEE